MKILIIHGWMHNAKLYEDLKNQLEKNKTISVELYELPGFGVTKTKYINEIINSYSNDLSLYLNQHHFDYIIAHSLGGNVVLKASSIKNIDSKIILLSPVYYGVNIFIFAIPFFWIIPSVLKLLKYKNFITDFIIKLVSLFTINSWDCITDDILEAAREADPIVATNLMKEMYKDRWEVSKIDNEISIILGEKDRVISKAKIKKLQYSLPHSNTFVIKRIGHTAILEAFNELVEIIEKLLNKEKL